MMVDYYIASVFQKEHPESYVVMRAAIIEECARVVDDLANVSSNTLAVRAILQHCARAIRALKDGP